MARVSLFDIDTDAQPFDEAVNTLLHWASEAAPRYICTCPVYTLMLAQERPDLRDVLLGADMVTADGMPVVWLQRWLGFTQAERVYGPDILQAVCARSAGTELTHFLWGGMPGVAERLCDTLLARYPGLQVVGAYSPPVDHPNGQPDPAALRILNEAAPDIIWVGLGSPKQDLWMAQYRPHLNAPVMIGVGAAFDILSGTKRQAPLWMRQRGLEWLFRLVQEPRRLWRRYLMYNPKFIWGVLRLYARRGER
jgi:N-acetylglucosaminyldiphosphoundecaprenol N-acetyl-beta-D-mannosaminyltransferase